MRKIQTERYIKPETICIGDTIKVTTKEMDTEVSRVGRVARRLHYNQITEYITAEGVSLLVQNRGMVDCKVTLLKREDGLDVRENNLQTLFDFSVV